MVTGFSVEGEDSALFIVLSEVESVERLGAVLRIVTKSGESYEVKSDKDTSKKAYAELVEELVQECGVNNEKT